MEVVERPWGKFEVLYENGTLDNNFKIKKITVNPDQQLSVQRHAHRDEVWTITAGVGKVLIKDKWEILVPGMVLKIPSNTIHSVKAGPRHTLVFVEVQLGDYLEEDDIERISDIYGRADEN